MSVEAVFRLPELLAQQLLELARERRLRSRLVKQTEGLHLGKGGEIRSPERLRLGKEIMIDSRVLLHCGGMEWSDGEGRISIWNCTYIVPNAVLLGAGVSQIV